MWPSSVNTADSSSLGKSGTRSSCGTLCSVGIVCWLWCFLCGAFLGSSLLGGACLGGGGGGADLVASVVVASAVSSLVPGVNLTVFEACFLNV